MQGQVAVKLRHRRRADREHPVTLDDQAQSVRQYLRAASLVDKVDGAAIQRLQLLLDQGVSGQEDDGQFDPALSQRTQQLEPRYLRQGPVEQHNLCLDAILQCLKEGRPIGKARHRKPPIGQVR
jgi:hypothetical protein